MKDTINNLTNENEFRSFVCALLDNCGFKINFINEGAGADGGRDIEATSFEYDTATRQKECISWWIELKFRSQQKTTSNLGINDLNDISSKIIRAASNGIDKFLLITNGKLSKELYNGLILVSKKHRIPLKIWDKDKITQAISSSNSFSNSKSFIKMADRNSEITTILNIINSNYKNVIQITGERGIGKSLLAKYIAKYLNCTSEYGYGYIDCKNYNQIGLQIKEMANSLYNQNISSQFVDSVSLTKSENERIQLLCEHILKKKTVIILDNFEFILDKSRKIKSPQIEILINFFFNNSTNGSIALITSQLSINSVYASQVSYLNIELSGWDIDYIIDSYIPTLNNINQQLQSVNLSKSEKCELFKNLYGNPFAFNVLNQLCEKNNLFDIIKSIHSINNSPQYLLEQLSGSLSSAQILALEKICQFSRPLDENEIIEFVCDKNTLSSLIYRGLIEKASILNNKFIVHPLTNHEFSLNNNPTKKSAVIKELTKTIESYVQRYHIDDLYPHNLMRQVIDMNMSILNFSKVAEILIVIGTRILSSGDIFYLNSIMDILSQKQLDSLLDVRLMKLKAHIESFSDRLFESKKIYENMLEKSIEINDPWSISAALNGLGSMARYVYDYDTAIANYVESACIRESNNMISELSNSLHNIGATYIIANDYKKAISALERACKIRRELKDNFRLSASMLYLGESYTLVGKYEKAEKIIIECKKIKENNNDNVGSIWCCCGLAKLYIISNNVKKLLSIEDILIEAKNLSYKLKITKHYALINIYLGILSYYKKDFASSIGYYNDSITLCQDFRKDILEEDIKSLTLLSLKFNVLESDKELIIDVVKKHKI